MLGWLFGGAKGDRAEGMRLFEQGMRAAAAFRTEEAIALYTRSIAASPNPSPYINRANLLMKRIRCRDALNDLKEAKRLDDRQGRQFGAVLAKEIAWAAMLAGNWENGTREKLIKDLRSSDHDVVAERILCASFGIDREDWQWGRFDRRLVEFHLFNDLDDIIKFDAPASYPEAAKLIQAYGSAFIDQKVARCPDQSAYEDAQTKLHNFLCSYDIADMVRLRRAMHRDIHSRLLSLDFGPLHESAGSGFTGVIKEAQRS